MARRRRGMAMSGGRGPARLEHPSNGSSPAPQPDQEIHSYHSLGRWMFRLSRVGWCVSRPSIIGPSMRSSLENIACRPYRAQQTLEEPRHLEKGPCLYGACTVGSAIYLTTVWRIQHTSLCCPAHGLPGLPGPSPAPRYALIMHERCVK